MLALIGFALALRGGIRVAPFLLGAAIVCAMLRLPLFYMLITKVLGTGTWVIRHAVFGLVVNVAVLVIALATSSEAALLAFAVVLTSSVTASVWIPFFRYSKRARAALSQ